MSALPPLPPPCSRENDRGAPTAPPSPAAVTPLWLALPTAAARDPEGRRDTPLLPLRSRLSRRRAPRTAHQSIYLSEATRSSLCHLRAPKRPREHARSRGGAGLRLLHAKKRERPRLAESLQTASPTRRSPPGSKSTPPRPPDSLQSPFAKRDDDPAAVLGVTLIHRHFLQAPSCRPSDGKGRGLRQARGGALRGRAEIMAQGGGWGVSGRRGWSREGRWSENQTA